jgi:RCC1 and BTB domain-containing protein
VEDFEERIEAMGEVKEHGIIEPKIQIEDYSYDVYYAFLKYIYTECIDIENEKSMDSLILANNYKDLKLKCIQLIKSSLTVENVCSLYCDSVDHQLEEMENIYFEFMKRRMKEISKTRGFIEMDDNSLKNFISKEEENNLFV